MVWYVTGFAKTVSKGTRDEIQLTAMHKSYTQALPRHTKYMAIDGLVCFFRRPFADPVKPRGCISRPVLPLGGTNREPCGSKPLPTTVSAYPVDCVCFCGILKTQDCCLCPNGRFSPPPAAHPPPPPTPPPSRLPTLYSISINYIKLHCHISWIIKFVLLMIHQFGG